MSVTILHGPTAAAVAAATSQQAQIDALEAPWAGGNVRARYYSAGGTLLRTLTIGPWVKNTGATPRRLVAGAGVADTAVAAGTQARVVFELMDGTPIVEVTASASASGAVLHYAAGAIKMLCRPTIALELLANAALPLTDPVADLSDITVFSEAAPLPSTSADQTLLLVLHASGGANYSTGRQYRAVGSEFLSHLTYTEIAWGTRSAGTALGKSVLSLHPVDFYGFRSDSTIRQSKWLGFTNAGEAGVRLITERRVDALMEWAGANLPVSATRRCATGGSMGAWGCITYALRRPTMFAAVYADRPIWRYTNYPAAQSSVFDWDAGSVPYTAATAPSLSAADGGGSVYDRRSNSIGYVANPANKVPWVGWCIGRNDGFAYFEDQIDAVDALRAGRRGFAFAWNNGTHSTGSIMSVITASYPFGLFELGRGYPLFENCSLDQDPRVDLEGGINIGLTFRTVVESASAWSCEVTHISSACTVDVSPISEVYTGSLTPQTINIPAANVWVPVSFGA